MKKLCFLNDTPLLKHMDIIFSDSLLDRFKRFNDRYLLMKKFYKSII